MKKIKDLAQLINVDPAVLVAIKRDAPASFHAVKTFSKIEFWRFNAALTSAALEQLRGVSSADRGVVLGAAVLYAETIGTPLYTVLLGLGTILTDTPTLGIVLNCQDTQDLVDMWIKWIVETVPVVVDGPNYEEVTINQIFQFVDKGGVSCEIEKKAAPVFVEIPLSDGGVFAAVGKYEHMPIGLNAGF